MKKTFLSLTAVLAAVILLAGCGTKPADQQTAPTNTNTSNKAVTPNPAGQTPAEESISGTIYDLLTRGQSLKCTFSSSEKDFSQSGTIYVAGTKLRMDSQTNDGKSTANTSMIKIGDENYMWSDQTPGKGTKFTFSREDEKALQEKFKSQNQQSQENIDPNKNMDYKCQNWTADQSKFTPPADVKFEDMTQIFKEMISQSDQINSQLCGICDSLPAGAAKDSCQKSNCK